MDFLRDYADALNQLRDEADSTLDNVARQWIDDTLWNLNHVLDLHKLATDGEIPEGNEHRTRDVKRDTSPFTPTDSSPVAIEDNRPAGSFIRREAAPAGQAASDPQPIRRDVGVALDDPNGTIPAETPRESAFHDTSKDRGIPQHPRESSQNPPPRNVGPQSPSDTPAQPRGPDTRPVQGLDPNVTLTRNDPEPATKPREAVSDPSDYGSLES